MNFLFISLLRLWKFIYYEYLKPSQTFTAIRLLTELYFQRIEISSCSTVSHCKLYINRYINYIWLKIY